MKKMSVLLSIVAALGFTPGCAKKQKADDIPVVGLGKDGESILRYVPKAKYLNRVSHLLGETSEAATDKLEKVNADENWNLSRVTIGLQIVTEMGLFDLIEVEFEPSVELRFQPLPTVKKI